MSEWAKELLHDVAALTWAECIKAFAENRGGTAEAQAVLERRLLGLLEAGEAMRALSNHHAHPEFAMAWDAAQAKASRP